MVGVLIATGSVPGLIGHGRAGGIPMADAGTRTVPAATPLPTPRRFCLVPGFPDARAPERGRRH